MSISTVFSTSLNQLELPIRPVSSGTMNHGCSNPALGEAGNPEIQTQQQAESHRGRQSLEIPSKSEVPVENLKDTLEDSFHYRHQSPG